MAHVDHGKTTLSDSLLMAAGMLSPKVAGQALALDYVLIEQLRQMTVKAANISLAHDVGGKTYVINLVDTPGHIDFSGHVTRSLRVMDGAIVVVDAVEGCMTQTETNIRLGMEERVRPLLYINKVDRLIKELRLSPSEVQRRIIEIIKDFNSLIESYGEPRFKELWKVDPAKGQVAFGSALHKWGLTIPIAQRKGVKFSYIVDAYERGYVDELQKTLPLYEPILDMVVEHVPNPVEAQAYRIPKIWRGDVDSDVGKAMVKCSEDGPAVLCVSKVVVDPHAGLVATGRVFSGEVAEGQPVYLMMARSDGRIQQVCLYMGPSREVIENVPAGNIVACLGVELARAGETIVDQGLRGSMVPFERMKYVSEPVVTMAIEPKHNIDLPRLVDMLHKMHIEDPTLHVKINQETGEYLISGMGTLHLEIALWDLNRRTGGLEVVTSPPQTVYREAILTRSGPHEGKSPNRHNKVYITVEPLDEATLRLVQEGRVFEDQDWRQRAKILREEAGWETDEARNIWAVDEHLNILTDVTKGLQYLREVKDYIIQGFRLSTSSGPLAQEPMRGLKVTLHDASVHEDPAHRGPAQIIPATRDSIFIGFLTAKPHLLEPILKFDFKIHPDYIREVTGIISSRRGRILNLEETGRLMLIKALMPVAETIGLSDELRSSTAGKAFWGWEPTTIWQPIPESMQTPLINKIRERKGLAKELPKPEDFIR